MSEITPMEDINAYIWNLKYGNVDPICEAAKETEKEQTFGLCERRLEWMI